MAHLPLLRTPPTLVPYLRFMAFRSRYCSPLYSHFHFSSSLACPSLFIKPSRYTSLPSITFCLFSVCSSRKPRERNMEKQQMTTALIMSFPGVAEPQVFGRGGVPLAFCFEMPLLRGLSCHPALKPPPPKLMGRIKFR